MMNEKSKILQREFNFELLSPDQRLREDGSPSGLKNIANVCYLNSLIQTYFHNPLFVEEILQFQFPLSLSFEQLIHTNESKAKRIKSSIDLVVHLQRLFAFMVFTSRKYVDPFAVVINVVDEFGNRFTIGDQKDLSEFNLQFLACIEEGLKYDERKVRQAEIDAKNNSPTKLSQAVSQIIDLTDDNNEETLSNKSCVLEQKPKQPIEQFKKIKKSYSQILASSQSLISQLFFGRSKESIQFAEQGQMKENEDEIEQIFLPIILGVQHKDLYTSWEANTRMQIENYRTSNGTLTYAEKHTWITKVPEALLFQIQRVGYDPIKGLVKQNNELRFEKEIYADRFLLENKDLSLRNQQDLDQLKKRKKDLETELLQYENYNKSGLSVLKILDSTNDFLSQNILTNNKPFQCLLKKFKSPSPSPVKRNNDEEFSSESTDKANLLKQMELLDSSKLSQDLHQSNNSKSQSEGLIQGTIKSQASLEFDAKSLSQEDELNRNIKSMDGFTYVSDDQTDILQPDLDKKVDKEVEPTPKLSIFAGIRLDESDANNNSQWNHLQDPIQNEHSNQDLERIGSQEMNDMKERVSKINNHLGMVRKKLEDICDDLKNRIKDISIEMDILYGSLKKHKYIIHSILIHEGAADTGHYYAYIYKHTKNIWYKFNDIHVSVVNEDKVLKDAYGDGKQKTNAYCIVYHRVGGKILECLNQPNYHDRIGSDLKLIAQKNSNSDNIYSYAQLINDQLRQEVLNDNIKFELELKEHQFSQQADSIAELYSLKFQFVNENVRKFKDNSKKDRVFQPPLCNFSVFLRYSYDDVNDYVKWSILDSAIREITDKKITIYDLKKHPIILQRLQFHFSNLNEFKAPSTLLIDRNVSSNMEMRLQEYIMKLQAIKTALYLFNQIDINNWKDSLSAVKIIIESTPQKYQSQDYIYLMALDIHSVQLLMLISQIFNKYDSISLAKVWQVIELIIAYTPLIKKGSILLKQMQLMLFDFQKMKGQTLFNQDQLANLSSYIKGIPECRYHKVMDHYYKEGEKVYNEQMNCELYEKDFFFWKIDDEDELVKQLDQGLLKVYSKLQVWINLHQMLIHTNQLVQYDRRVSLGFHKDILFLSEDQLNGKSILSPNTLQSPQLQSTEEEQGQQ